MRSYLNRWRSAQANSDPTMSSVERSRSTQRGDVYETRLQKSLFWKAFVFDGICCLHDFDRAMFGQMQQLRRVKLNS